MTAIGSVIVRKGNWVRNVSHILHKALVSLVPFLYQKQKERNREGYQVTSRKNQSTAHDSSTTDSHRYSPVG